MAVEEHSIRLISALLPGVAGISQMRASFRGYFLGLSGKQKFRQADEDLVQCGSSYAALAFLPSRQALY